MKIKTLASLALLLLPSVLQANIQVFPTRINLSPSEKTATISIRLRADKPQTFRISTMFYEMAKDGAMKQRPDLSRSTKSAASYIRFSPKRVELRPNVEQVVRIRVRNIAKLKDEVRTHLYFRPADPVVEKGPLKQSANAKSSIELKAQVAVAVPIVVTPRFIKKDFQLSRFKLFKKDGEAFFKVQLANKSKGFLYGDFKIYHMRGSKRHLVGAAKGVSSYIKNRSVSYSLLNTKNAQLKKGRYILEFTEYSQTAPEKGVTKKIEYKLG